MDTYQICLNELQTTVDALASDMVGPFLSCVINTDDGRSLPKKSESNTAHPKIGLHPNPCHARAIFFLPEALADPSGHGRGRSWGRCGRRSRTSVGRGGTSCCSRRRGACRAPRPAAATVGPSRACSTATAPRWQGPGVRSATGRPRCGRSCGPAAGIPSSRPRSVWCSPSSPSSSSSVSHATPSATPSAASCLLSSLFLLTYLWFGRCSTNWKGTSERRLRDCLLRKYGDRKFVLPVRHSRQNLNLPKRRQWYAPSPCRFSAITFSRFRCDGFCAVSFLVRDLRIKSSCCHEEHGNLALAGLYFRSVMSMSTTSQSKKEVLQYFDYINVKDTRTRSSSTTTPSTFWLFPWCGGGNTTTSSERIQQRQEDHGRVHHQARHGDHVAILFVPSPDYGRPVSPACCSSDYGRPASRHVVHERSRCLVGDRYGRTL